MVEENKEAKKPKLNIPSPEELMNANVHLGHHTRRWSPAMSPYIYDKKGGIHIIDLFKTHESLKRACEFLYNTASEGGRIIFVGTKRQASDIIKSEAQRSSGLYVENRWLGGTITNFKQIKKNIKTLIDLRKKLKAGEFDHYTKKERLEIERKIIKLEKVVGGIVGLTDIPDALFVIDVKREKTAIREAQRVGVPVVALTDTNSNPRGVEYIIPGNDDSIKSLLLIIKTVADAVEQGYRVLEAKGSGEGKQPSSASSPLKPKGRPVKEKKEDKKTKIAVKKGKKVKKGKSVKVEDSGLSKRSKNALIKAGYTTMSKVAKLGRKELEGIKGLGEKSITEIIKAVREFQ